MRTLCWARTLTFAGLLGLAAALPGVAWAQSTHCVANCIPPMPPCQGPVGGSGCPLPTITDCASWAAAELQQGIAQLDAMASSLPPSSSGDRLAQVIRFKEALENCLSSKAAAPSPPAPAPPSPRAAPASPAPPSQGAVPLPSGQVNQTDPNLAQPLPVNDPGVNGSGPGGCGGLSDGTICASMGSLFTYLDQLNSGGSAAFQAVPPNTR